MNRTLMNVVSVMMICTIGLTTASFQPSTDDESLNKNTLVDSQSQLIAHKQLHQHQQQIKNSNSIIDDTNSITEVPFIDSELLVNRQREIQRSEFDFKIQLDNMRVFYGLEETIWIQETETNGSKHTVYLSRDNGQTFKKFGWADLKVDALFFNSFNQKNVIVSDSANKAIVKSTDNAKSFTTQSLTFAAEAFYFTEDSKVVFASEKEGKAINFWISADFGDSWHKLATGLDQLPQWNINVIYYIDQQNKTIVEFDLLNFKMFHKEAVLDDYISEMKEITENTIVDFKLHATTLFVKTVKEDKSIEIVKSFLTRVRRITKRVNLVLHFNQEFAQIEHFEVMSMSSYETMLALFTGRDNSKWNDLFASKVDDTMSSTFGLSKKNVSLDESNKKPELEQINERGGTYLANFNEEGKKRTYLKKANQDWSPVSFNFDSTTRKSASFYLNLGKNFFISHEESQNSFMNPKLPEFMIATAESNVEGPSSSFICVYNENQDKWVKVLDGSYLYAIADYGHIILAVPTDKLTSEFVYSYDFGATWTTYRFTKKIIIADDLIKNPNHDSFSLFARNTFDSLNTIVFRFDFSQGSVFKSRHHYNQEQDGDLLFANHKHTDTQVKFECEKTCISRMTFEETCVVNETLENCVQDTSNTNKNQKKNQNQESDFKISEKTYNDLTSSLSKSKQQESLVLVNKDVLFFNEYFLGMLIALMVLLVALVLLVLVKLGTIRRNKRNNTCSNFSSPTKMGKTRSKVNFQQIKQRVQEMSPKALVTGNPDGFKDRLIFNDQDVDEMFQNVDREESQRKPSVNGLNGRMA